MRPRQQGRARTKRSVCGRWSLTVAVVLMAATTLSTCRRAGGAAAKINAQYSVAPSLKPSVLRSFPTKSSIRLHRTIMLGAPDGRPDQIFGFVTDVGLDSNGNLYVVDPYLKRISVFDSAGNFVDSWGRTGAGPGEFVEPYSIAVLDTTIAVLDERTKRVELFGMQGGFRRQVTIGAVAEVRLSRGPDGMIVLARSTAATDTAALTVLDPSSLSSRLVLHAPAVTSNLYGPYFAQPGGSCGTDDGSLFYVNSWVYEIVRVAWPSTQPAQRFVRRSDILTPTAPSSSQVGPAIQRGAVLGLVCDKHHLVLAFADPSNGRFDYDVYSRPLKPARRLAFRRADDKGGSTIPGFVGDLRNGRLATYRDSPHPQVFVYRVVQR